ncbi:hypothetical protein DPMN_017454 [Dreissena polymorpha]|uniref:Uncharacterized protein n=1 Tax=Dreissena polymorpha TaxID=45954 RepID=A0A9D4NHI0_DREPO|nr:hypothetical protein DPMN_017454 [Dreissena polymorpha]
MKCKLNEQKDENEHLRKQLKQQESSCEMKINEMEQYSRQSNIKIDGIPDNDKETANETTAKVLDTLNRNIPDLHLSEHDIDITHRIGNFDNRKPRPIVLKLISRIKRSKIMQSAKILRRQKTPLYINDHLTKLYNHILACVRKKTKRNSNINLVPRRRHLLQ